MVAEIGTEGTQATSEFVTPPELLAEALRELSSGWQKKRRRDCSASRCDWLLPRSSSCGRRLRVV